MASFVIRYASDYEKGAQYPHPLTSLWNRVVALGLYILIIWILDILVTLHRQLEARVVERTADLKKAVHELTALQDELTEVGRRERGAIGHELHDGLGQHLTATALAAEIVAERLSGRQDPVAVQARAVVGLIQDGIAQTRQSARVPRLRKRQQRAVDERTLRSWRVVPARSTTSRVNSSQQAPST